jgi:tRNA(fMet)-specific endonuclease VapC
MQYLLDTNACIVHLRSGGAGSVSARLASASPRDVALCSVVVAELVFGALRSQNKAKNLADVAHFAAGFVSLPFDDAAARHHAELRAHLAPLGTPIGPYDSMIAAIALAHDVTLITHNVVEFSRVPTLKIEDWQTP